MKTILVDAINCFVFEDGTMFNGMYDLLEGFPNKKIVLTGADDKRFIEFGLDKLPYPVFTLKHDPDKSDPVYFETMLDHFNLNKDDVVYFEHNPKAVKSAESIGIKSYLYNDRKQNLVALKDFLIANL